jgi:hypothetical protein
MLPLKLWTKNISESVSKVIRNKEFTYIFSVMSVYIGLEILPLCFDKIQVTTSSG